MITNEVRGNDATGDARVAKVDMKFEANITSAALGSAHGLYLPT